MRKLLLISALAAVSAGAFGQSLVFDSMSGSPTYTYTGSTPHAMGGMAFSLGNTTGATTITGLDFAFITTVAASYSNVVADISFFNTASNATTGTSAAFTSLAANYRVTLGALSPTGAQIWTVQNSTSPGSSAGVTFTTPFSFSGSTNLGVQMLFLADSGSGLAYTDQLAFAIRHTAAPTVGSFTAGTAGTFGYYRNASQTSPTSSTTSMLGSDFRSLSGSPAPVNEGIPMRLYTSVPEPTTMAVLGLGVAAMLRRRKKS